MLITHIRFRKFEKKHNFFEKFWNSSTINEKYNVIANEMLSIILGFVIFINITFLHSFLIKIVIGLIIAINIIIGIKPSIKWYKLAKKLKITKPKEKELPIKVKILEGISIFLMGLGVVFLFLLAFQKVLFPYLPFNITLLLLGVIFVISGFILYKKFKKK